MGFVTYLELNNVTNIRVSEIREKSNYLVDIHNGDFPKSPLDVHNGVQLFMISLTLTYMMLFSFKEV